MPRFRSFWDETPITHDDIRGSSQTIPDQSLSVRDILNRYQLGSIQLQFPSASQIDDSDYVDSFPADLDLVEASEMINQGVDLLRDVSNSSSCDVSETSSANVSPDQNV